MRARAWRSDDTGASLAMALIFVVVIAVVVGAVMSFADVNFRSTIALRQQSEAAAAADGAGQIAVNALRKSAYTGTGNCFGASNTLSLPNFYDTPSGPQTSAAVTCDFDPDLSISDGGIPINTANKPPKAILTLSSSADLRFDPNGHTINVKGSIYSNDDIFVSGSGDLRATGAVEARGSCSDDIESTPPPDCNNGGPAFPDPDYVNPPTGVTTLRSPPACTGPGNPKKLTFLPGRYTDVDDLDDLTKPSGCNNAIFAFGPGIYYFDFDGQWDIETGYVVAGDPVNVNAGTVPTIPGSCQVPAPPNPVPAGGMVAQNPAAPAGAIFMMGRGARIRVASGAKFEICGPYSATRPPIAIFGVDDRINGVIEDQEGCVVGSSPFGFCPVIETSGSANFIVQGSVYVPKNNVEITITPPNIQTISSGIIARSLDLTTNGSVSYPVAQLPGNSTGVGLTTVVYLKVYVCPGAATCAASGTPRLDAKVALTDASGTPTPNTRKVTVLNWNTMR